MEGIQGEDHNDDENNNDNKIVSVGTIPFVLLEAYDSLQSRRAKSTNNNKIAVVDAAQRDIPVDIVVVVLDIITCDPSHPKGPKIQVQIVDGSLQNGQKAFFELSGKRYSSSGNFVVSGSGTTSYPRSTTATTTTTMTTFEWDDGHAMENSNNEPKGVLFSLGDIVRFNRVALLVSNPQLEQQQNQSKLDSIPTVLQFYHSPWDDDRDYGPKLCRLYRLQMMSGTLIPMPGIAPTHITDPVFLRHLLQWYQRDQCHYYLAQIISHKQRSLNPLLLLTNCLRSIPDFQACLGIQGDLGAITVEAVRTSSARTLGKNSKKARRVNPYTIAIFSDCHHHRIAFFDRDNRFTRILQQALDHQRPIRIGPVQSCRASDLPCGLHSIHQAKLGCYSGDNSEEVVLVCDLLTKVVLSSQQENEAEHLPASNSYGSCFSHSQQSPTPKSILDVARFPKQILGKILELHVNGSVVNKYTLPDQAIQILFSTDEIARCFPEAKLLLLLDDCSSVGKEWAAAGRKMELHLLPKSGILQELCGGIQWEELTANPALRQKSILFLLSLFTDDTVQLEWDLGSSFQNYNNQQDGLPSVEAVYLSPALVI